MRIFRRWNTFTGPALLFFAFCAAPSPVSSDGLSAGYHVWRGDIVIGEQVVVGEDATLYLAPGTRVTISKVGNSPDLDVVQPLFVKGRIVVDGREGKPVVVTGQAGWGEIYLEDAVAVIRHMKIENATWAFHIHGGFTFMEHCEISGSGGGMRTFREGMYVKRCFFHDNNIAIRYWQGGPVVRESRISGNRVGIFFREGHSSAIFRDNYIDSGEYNLKIGDFAAGSPDVRGNFWGTDDMGEIKEKVFDGRDRKLARDEILPILPAPPRLFRSFP